MKSTFLIFISLLVNINLFAQSEFVAKPDLDKGFGVLAINKKIDSIKQYLLKVDKKQLKDTAYKNQLGGMLSSAWILDLKKAGMEYYLGLKVQRIEVFFQNESEDDKNMKENIFSFIVWIDKPSSEKAHLDFVSLLYKQYGGKAEYLMTEDKKDFIHNTWWTLITLCRVIYGIDADTGKRLNYYQARFEQAYGG